MAEYIAQVCQSVSASIIIQEKNIAAMSYS
jgi:hypothetical protein